MRSAFETAEDARRSIEQATSAAPHVAQDEHLGLAAFVDVDKNVYTGGPGGAPEGAGFGVFS